MTVCNSRDAAWSCSRASLLAILLLVTALASQTPAFSAESSPNRIRRPSGGQSASDPRTRGSEDLPNDFRSLQIRKTAREGGSTKRAIVHKQSTAKGADRGKSQKSKVGSDKSQSGRSHESGRAIANDDRLRFPPGEYEGDSIDDGFVFVDGEFVPGPYVFRSSSDQSFVNGIRIAEQLCKSDIGDEQSEERRRKTPPRKPLAHFLSREFDSQQCVLIAFRGHDPVLLHPGSGGRDILCALLAEEEPATLLRGIPLIARGDAESAIWLDWISSYRPTETFRDRAQPIVDRINEVVAEQEARQMAVQRLDRFTYPLTLAGMLISVYAFGHLVSNPPNGAGDSAPVNDSPHASRVVARSLMAVVMLSALDLGWTLLASQAGVMREVNPIGGMFLDNTAQLIQFKILLTGLAVGLMFSLRRYHRVQVASWWVCLILILLTVRWLTFSSMMA